MDNGIINLSGFGTIFSCSIMRRIGLTVLNAKLVAETDHLERFDEIDRSNKDDAAPPVAVGLTLRSRTSSPSKPLPFT